MTRMILLGTEKVCSSIWIKIQTNWTWRIFPSQHIDLQYKEGAEGTSFSYFMNNLFQSELSEDPEPNNLGILRACGTASPKPTEKAPQINNISFLKYSRTGSLGDSYIWQRRSSQRSSVSKGVPESTDSWRQIEGTVNFRIKKWIHSVWMTATHTAEIFPYTRSPGINPFCMAEHFSFIVLC